MQQPSMFLEYLFEIFSLGGIVIAVLAGTGLADKSRSWWRSAAVIALLGAAINVGGQFLTWPNNRIMPAPIELVPWFCLFLAGTFVVAGTGRILARIGLWPPLRIALCLATDVVVRGGIFLLVLYLACYMNDCL